MEIIRALFLPGEKVLWHKTMSKESTNERNYVVTNRRIYKKHYKVAQSDYSEYPERVVKVLGDILIVERFGIKIIRSAHKLSLFLETDHEDQLYRFYPFGKLNKYEIIEVKTILLDTDNLLYDDDIRIYQQSHPESAYVQDGSITQGYQEEKRKREVLEQKVRYLNEKVNQLNQNIQFQKSLAEKSKEQLEMRSQQEIGSRDKLVELNKKTLEIENLRNKINEVNFYARQEMEKKDQEIYSLKQNISKLIGLHSAAKPKQAPLLPEEISIEKWKIERRKQKLKQDRIKLMSQRAQLMAKEKKIRESMLAVEVKQKETPRALPSLQPQLISPPRPQAVPLPKPQAVPPPQQRNAIVRGTKEKLAGKIDSSPSFSSHLKKELGELISHAKSVSSSLNEEKLDLTGELHDMSFQLMQEREKLIKDLESEVNSLENMIQPLPPITIISTPSSQVHKKHDKSRLIEYSHGRRTCPACGNQDKYPIKEIVDKDNIISYSPRIYGKKYICGDCMTEWRQESVQ